MTKSGIYDFVVEKFNDMSEEHADFTIASFKYLNKHRLSSDICDKYDIASYLSDKWYHDDISEEEIENEWNNFHDYYNDADGLYYGLEDENGYLV